MLMRRTSLLSASTSTLPFYQSKSRVTQVMFLRPFLHKTMMPARSAVPHMAALDEFGKHRDKIRGES